MVAGSTALAAYVSKQNPLDHDALQAEAHRTLRDLMSLLALPALWAERDAAAILLNMLEAVEHIVAIDCSYVDVQALAEHSAIEYLRVSGAQYADEQLSHWQMALRDFRKMSITTAASVCHTPIGPLHVVRLSFGYSAQSGCVWFGSANASFPTVAQAALLRAATMLAATGLKSARIAHERQRASRAKDEFLAMLGHELRNPLAPIFTSLELIKRQTNAPLNRPHLIIERQARHLSRLVDDLLDVSRIARGKVDLDQRDVLLSPILAAALEATSPLFEQQRHVLALDLCERAIVVHADAVRLTQVFANLLNNAAKYTPANGRISVHVSQSEGQVIIRIKDNGMGISTGLMPRIFEIFEQGVTTVARSEGGLGVGLALVKNFVHLHGGTVTASSDGPGQGSEFTVTLPVSRADQPRTEAAGTDEPLPEPIVNEVHEGLRILLVDDNQDATESMAGLLRDLSINVAIATDAQDALSLVDSFNPAIAIIDIGLPGKDGHELAIELRRRFPSRAIRLIALSGYGQQDDRLRSIAAGFERHLVKPVDIFTLTSLVFEGRSSSALDAVKRNTASD